MNIGLLRTLREAGGAFVAIDGDEAGRDLDELIAFGFAIERQPDRGAAYRGPSARLCPDQIEWGLETTRVGRRIAVWNRVASTNDLAARAASSRANEGLVVLAEEQTAGRGRRGRSWVAPPCSSILMSVLLFPEGPLLEPSWLTALGAVAVAEVVAEWAGRPSAIKWPNDVRVDGRKIAGILVERGAGAVIGIGLNANAGPEDFPPDLREAATSMEILCGAKVDRSELARGLVDRVDRLYEEARREGPWPLGRRWKGLSEHVGRRVVVETGTGAEEGLLEDLDLWEGARLRGEDGAERRIEARHVLGVRGETTPPRAVDDAPARPAREPWGRGPERGL